MPFTYAGVDISPADGAQDVLAGYYHDFRIQEFDYPAHLSSGIDYLPIPYPPRREPPRLGVLQWPTDVSRWATFHTVVTQRQLEAIFSAMGSAPAEKTLVWSDGIRTLSADMWMMAPRYISDRDGLGAFYITLVDRRWWQNQQSGTCPPEAGITSWLGLIGSLQAQIADTGSLPAIATAYGAPTASRWALGYRPICPILDAAIRSCGCRYVRNLDGSSTVQLPATALAADETRDATYGDLILSGGRATLQMVAQSIPEAVAVVFTGSATNVINKTLAGLSLSDYSARAGAPGWIGQVIADMDASSAHASRDAYAVQAATDYYLWGLSRTEATYRGFLDVGICGLDDVVEWVQLPGRQGCVTRVLRREISDRNLWGYIPVNNNSAVSNCCLTVTKTSGVVTDVALSVETTSVATGETVCVTNPGDCCTPETGFECNAGACSEVVGGAYTNISDCLAACIDHTETITCLGHTWPKYLCVHITADNTQEFGGPCSAIPSGGVYAIAEWTTRDYYGWQFQAPISLPGVTIAGGFINCCDPTQWNTGICLGEAIGGPCPNFWGAVSCPVTGSAGIAYACGVYYNQETLAVDSAAVTFSIKTRVGGVRFDAVPFTGVCGAVGATYNCVGASCVDPGDGTGTYSTLAACEAACTGGGCTKAAVAHGAAASSVATGPSGTATATITGLNFDAGSVIVVSVACFGDVVSTANSFSIVSATCSGASLAFIRERGGNLGDCDQDIMTFAGATAAAVTGGTVEIKIQYSGSAYFGIIAGVMEYKCLANLSHDVGSDAFGSNSQPYCGSSPTTNVSSEYAHGAFSLVKQTSAGTLNGNGFTAGNALDVDFTFAHTTRQYYADGYKDLTTTTTFNAAFGAGGYDWFGIQDSFS